MQGCGRSQIKRFESKADFHSALEYFFDTKTFTAVAIMPNNAKIGWKTTKIPSALVLMFLITQNEKREIKSQYKVAIYVNKRNLISAI